MRARTRRWLVAALVALAGCGGGGDGAEGRRVALQARAAAASPLGPPGGADTAADGAEAPDAADDGDTAEAPGDTAEAPGDAAEAPGDAAEAPDTADATDDGDTAEAAGDAAAPPDAGPDAAPDAAPDTADPCAPSPIACTADDEPAVNGVPVEPPGLGGCPAGMAPAGAVCVDRWEASLARVEPDGSLSPWSPYAHPAGEEVVALSAPGVVPQGYIDQLQAAGACGRAGKRLCTDAEWLAACDVAAAACNGSRPCHPAVQYFGTSEAWIWSQLGHPCLNQLPAGLAPTGAFAACVTPAGLHDMVGNLHEWTADPAGTFRGGFYVDTKVNGAGCAYVTTAHTVSYWDYSTGFRCCADP